MLRVGITNWFLEGDEHEDEQEDYYYDPVSNQLRHSHKSKELIHMVTKPTGLLEYQSPSEGRVRICLSLTKSMLNDSSFSGEQMVSLRVVERVDMRIDEGEYDHSEKNGKENSLLFPEVDLTQMTPEEAKEFQERHARLRKDLLSRERLNMKSVLLDQLHEKLSKDAIHGNHREALEQFHRDQQTARSHFSELETLLLKFVEQSEMLITSYHLVKK